MRGGPHGLKEVEGGVYVVMCAIIPAVGAASGKKRRKRRLEGEGEGEGGGIQDGVDDGDGDGGHEEGSQNILEVIVEDVEVRGGALRGRAGSSKLSQVQDERRGSTPGRAG